MDRIEKLKEYLANHPSDSFLQHALALEYVKKGDLEQAKSLFQSLLLQNENYVGSYYQLARLLMDMGQAEEAKGVLEKGLLKAKEAGDQHAYNELLAAYEDLIY